MNRKKFGWLDATIFIHVLFANDPHHARCKHIVETLEKGDGEGGIDAVVIHELTYVLPSALPKVFTDRAVIAEYILSFLILDAVYSNEKEVLIASLQTWSTSNVGFADARLRILGEKSHLPVCSVRFQEYPQYILAIYP